MESSCDNVSEYLIIFFFLFGCILTIFGTLLNLCSCFLFCRERSLRETSYAIFIIALSIADIVKLMAEYSVHLVYFYIQHPYFVCSITWFLTMTSETLSYLFLAVLGVERNLKVWVVNRRCLITRQRAFSITLLIIIGVIIHDHLFLFFPYDVSYCIFQFYNHSILFTCDNAMYKAYGYTYSLTDLILFESIGLNNLILPIFILLINIFLILGLQRRAYQRRRCLGGKQRHEWKEQSVILYVFLSSLTFLLLTTPIGILNAWSSKRNHRLATNKLAMILDLLEILHHCTHFPILLMTSSVIRKKTVQIILHRRHSVPSLVNSRQSRRKQYRTNTKSQ